MENETQTASKGFIEWIISKAHFFKFAFSSMISAFVDFVFFYFLSEKAFNKFEDESLSIFLATIIARIISGIVNYFLNRLWSFRSKKDTEKKIKGFYENITQIAKFTAVFTGKVLLSALGVDISRRVFPSFIPLLVYKFVVDSILFIANYMLQKIWVFKKK